MDTAVKREYTLQNLCCPTCAAKIEKHIQALEGVDQALIDFSSQRLTIEAKSADFWDDIMNRAERIIKDLEPSVELRNTASRPRERGAGAELDKNPPVSPRVLSRRLCLGLGGGLFAAGLIVSLPPPAGFGVFLASYLLVGGEVVLKAVKNILKGELFDENFLMSIATVGAFAIGEYPEGAAVMIFYRIGEIFEELAVNRSRKSIASLMDIRPDYANLKTADGIQRVPPETVQIGDRIVVKPGEKVPLDGIVEDGTSALDTSALTGESVPKDVEKGAAVLSGSINKNGLLTIAVTKTFGESTVSKILDLVQNAGSKKSAAENFITRFARYYTPAVVFSALALAILPPLFLPEARFAEWTHRALVFLVVSCPCALVISIPLSFFGGIGGASRRGILIKGGNYLEALTQVDTVVFDKTGTLTKGVFKVTKAVSSRFTEEELLFYAAYGESNSTHPIGVSIRQAYGRRLEEEKIREYEEIPGQGVRVLVGEDRVLAGNGKLFEEAHIPVPRTEEPGTVVYLGVNEEFAGYLVISDEVKPGAAQAVQELRSLGVTRIVMLTGDSSAVGERVGQETGVDEVYAELLPQDKVAYFEEFAKKRSGSGKTIFAGDGVNDAPVLARSDVGVAMGGAGSDAAIEAADVVLMTDELSKIPEALRIAKKTRGIVTQNIIFALGVKGCILVLGALGIATMWGAVFGDVGVLVIAVLNAMRGIKTPAA